MIQIVFKPEKAPVVRGESLYRAVFNQKDTVFSGECETDGKESQLCATQ